MEATGYWVFFDSLLNNMSVGSKLDSKLWIETLGFVRSVLSNTHAMLCFLKLSIRMYCNVIAQNYDIPYTTDCQRATLRSL